MAEIPPLLEVTRYQEPTRQAGLGLLEDGAGENRVLLAAGRALLDQALLMAVSQVMPAAGAAEAHGPTRPHQIRPAFRVRAEALQKVRQIARQILQQLGGHRALQPRVLSLFTLARSAARVKLPEPRGELVPGI